MTPDDARSAVTTALGKVAPELDPAHLTDDARLRQDLDLDSLDFLRLLETVAEVTGVETPESDYGKVTTVGGLVGYVAAHG